MELVKLVKYLEKSQWQIPTNPVPNKPILTREKLQKLIIKKGDFQSQTLGTTGTPLIIQKSKLTFNWREATNIRFVQWFGWNPKLSLAIIKSDIIKPGFQTTWGNTYNNIFGTSGNLHTHPITGDFNTWLQGINPHYLSTYPSILDKIDYSKLTNLKGIKTTGEVSQSQSPRVADVYSAAEVGNIAIQCPTNKEAYHIMENINVEILDDMDQPTNIGRVVVSDLSSSYLHRYDIGDYAELGKCNCGRGLPVIKKILGRHKI
jgi:phenylacetate-CoA ligase